MPFRGAWARGLTFFASLVRRLDLAVFCDPGGQFKGRIGAESVEGAEPTRFRPQIVSNCSQNPTLGRSGRVGLLGALVQAVIVGLGALLIVVGLLYGVTSWIAGLLGLS